MINIQQLQSGHEPAWAQFFDTIQPALFDAIEMVTDERQEAEELLSHIMLAVVRSIAPAPVPASTPSAQTRTHNRDEENPLELTERKSS